MREVLTSSLFIPSAKSEATVLVLLAWSSPVEYGFRLSEPAQATGAAAPASEAARSPDQRCHKPKHGRNHDEGRSGPGAISIGRRTAVAHLQSVPARGQI